MGVLKFGSQASAEDIVVDFGGIFLFFLDDMSNFKMESLRNIKVRANTVLESS